ncbi:MAG TPA: cyclodeaminase/cyclohydrolase family protein [Anaerolineae bacterium]|nr:cyclodeaminase/cyclohydrolase family protein [Anaerolineae bacterium]
MALQLTEKPIRQFVGEVSDQRHAMAGAVIAAAAAQATALGEACMQISLDHQVDKLDWQDVTSRIEQMVHIKNTLIEWCDQDASAIAEYVALRDIGEELSGQRVLCDSPAEISRLCIEAAAVLQNFRPLVIEQVQDDLEIAISLLAGTAQAAMLLLDSNLRIWPDSALLAEYEPIRLELEKQISQLSPLQRIRKDEG